MIGLNDNAYAILQLKNDDSNALRLFSSMGELRRMRLTPVTLEHYDVVYTSPLFAFDNIHAFLENTYEKFRRQSSGRLSWPKSFCIRHRGH